MQFDTNIADLYVFRDQFGNFYLRRVCLIPPGRKVPGHPCIGPNRVLDIDGFFLVNQIVDFINSTQMKAETIPFDDIWFQKHEDEERYDVRQTDRYRSADPSFPGILAELRNPGKKRFRMLDGRRRLWKQQERGASEGMFYVIPVPKVFDFFWAVASPDDLLTHLG
ncbi:MAG: hypothetical protein GTN86_11040 [Xanthomonadales bacterium]|nr:hypothetical protein [Xanthomonadales bacterium]NIN60269.1 hypothetical protein [Xanthomonadales bacterium]NIN75621.1 hypothetical protein [Xanthomonadales bacterium]NIO14694.1 hypothetical protein [Xanthomonadales bacterium]NIP12662.1 hypothetical protein [Xanthomonadales bacterium]